MAALTSALRRPRVAIPLEVALVVAWLAIRTATPADGPLFAAWAIVVAVVMILSPLSGLVVLAATAPFDEPFTITQYLGPRMLLVFVLAGSVAARVIVRPRSMPWSWPIAFAGLLAIGTLGSIVVGYPRFGRDFSEVSFEFWVAGVGGGMAVLLAAAWIAREGELRPMIAAIAASVVGAAITVVDYLAPALLAGGPLSWMLHAKEFGFRISGVIPSPNGLASLLLPPAMILAAAALLAPRRSMRLRVLALVGLAPMVPALYFTYSRTVFVACYGFAVVAAWRVRRWLGVAVLVVGVAVGVLALPSYLTMRAQVVVEGARTESILVASDIQRFTAWGASIQMFADRPVTGWGFRSYRVIGDRYGDRVLNSPHNEWLRFFAEQGIAGGLVGVAFVLTGLARLARIPGWFGAGMTSAFLAYVLSASFNNPLLFIQVSIVAFTIVGTGFAWGRRPPPGEPAAGAPSPTDAGPTPAEESGAPSLA
ncbi:MAG TPA: O-antigen ligase family protein [Candidatus Limnocylindrales bacterium]|nr:O-antigen ligase family protein [Candidatus Limnocylindrales bacterium]